MSRWIKQTEDGKYDVRISSLEECRDMYNEVCCNERSDERGEFVDSEYCKARCPHFRKEDGLSVEG